MRATEGREGSGDRPCTSTASCGRFRVPPATGRLSAPFEKCGDAPRASLCMRGKARSPQAPVAVTGHSHGPRAALEERIIGGTRHRRSTERRTNQ
jgi:hypothetical protein